MQADALFFWILAPLLVVSAFAVIVAKNPVHSVLFLILSFVCAAGLFLLMGAEFLASAPDDSRDRMIETIKVSAWRGAELVKQVLMFVRGGDRPDEARSTA